MILFSVIINIIIIFITILLMIIIEHSVCRSALHLVIIVRKYSWKIIVWAPHKMCSYQLVRSYWGCTAAHNHHSLSPDMPAQLSLHKGQGPDYAKVTPHTNRAKLSYTSKADYNLDKSIEWLFLTISHNLKIDSCFESIENVTKPYNRAQVWRGRGQRRFSQKPNFVLLSNSSPTLSWTE